MSKYTYKLSNYRAVKEAEVRIEGITVLAGENGAGKSTLSRWLYYIVKVLSEFDVLIDTEATREMLSILRRIERFGTAFERNASVHRYSYSEMLEILGSDVDISYKIERMIEYVEKYVCFVSENVKAYGLDAYPTKRLLTLFDMGDENFSDINKLIDAINAKLINRLTTIQNETTSKKENRDSKTYMGLLRTIVENGDELTAKVNFTEDGVDLLDEKHFTPVINLSRVIYYKTYKLMDYLNDDSDFHRFLEIPVDKMTDQERLVYKVISQIIGGKVNLRNDAWSFHREQLFYKRKDGLEIPLQQAATGLVSFSYLARLLENGYLRKDTLLIIDEPEAHLHPRWIVEFARILVLLQKKMDLKIVLSTHNPDMVAAIDAIARKEDVSSRVNFYFAKEDTSNNDYTFVYERLSSIGEIFDSFNIALTNIQKYGDE